MTTQLAINIIRTDGNTQPRAEVNEWKVRDYALDMLEGDEFPPVVVFYDGDHYWLSAGFHRIAAARQIGRETILASVREGGSRDAFLHAVDDNRHNGVQYTNADKRAMVERFLSDSEWQKWSDREIARRCGVSQPFVSGMRGDTDNGYQYDADRTFRHHKTGQPATMNTANIGKREEAINNYFAAHPELERFVCENCGETFDIQVWHCPVCDHHWQMHRTECWNCHEYERDLDSAERAELSKIEEWDNSEDGDYPYGEAQIQEAEETPTGMTQPMSLLTSQETVEWYTPPGIIERARAVLGTIDLDPASSDVAQQWIQAGTHYTAETLAHEPWAGRVWLNPPFDDTPAWVDQLELYYEEGGITEAVLLVNSAPGYIWWEELWRRRPVCMLRERLCFYRADGTAGGQAKKGTTIAYYGKDAQRFIEHFSDLGRIILPDEHM